MKNKQNNIKDEFEYYLNSIKDQRVEQYISNRILKQIEWYDNKSLNNQFKYKIFTTISIIISATIPVLTNFLDLKYSKYIKLCIALFSTIATILSFIITLNNYNELWINYRTSCENLKSITYRFLTKSGEFKDLDDAKAFELLVMICENYMEKEYKYWKSMQMDNSKSNDK